MCKICYSLSKLRGELTCIRSPAVWPKSHSIQASDVRYETSDVTVTCWSCAQTARRRGGGVAKKGFFFTLRLYNVRVDKRLDNVRMDDVRVNKYINNNLALSYFALSKALR